MTKLFLPMVALLSSFTSSLQAEAPAAHAPEFRIACVGDSITQGSGAGRGKSYPSQLQELLGEKWAVGNFGVSGRTLLKKGDHPYWNEKAYKNALAHAPHVVIIMLGTNDTKPQNWKFSEEFYPDYEELVKSFQELPSKPIVFVCRPCPVPGKGNFGINDNNLQVVIQQVDKLAKDKNLRIIDMHQALKDHPEMLPDRVHPNAAGAGLMAKAASEAILAIEKQLKP
ncbi:MAG: GDSL-type esterase/lipase family protein [Akkermansiaceae bacterium]